MNFWWLFILLFVASSLIVAWVKWIRKIHLLAQQLIQLHHTLTLPSHGDFQRNPVFALNQWVWRCMQDQNVFLTLRKSVSRTMIHLQHCPVVNLLPTFQVAEMITPLDKSHFQHTQVRFKELLGFSSVHSYYCQGLMLKRQYDRFCLSKMLVAWRDLWYIFLFLFTKDCIPLL